jgi:hypothetical protein
MRARIFLRSGLVDCSSLHGWNADALATEWDIAISVCSLTRAAIVCLCLSVEFIHLQIGLFLPGNTEARLLDCLD